MKLVKSVLATIIILFFSLSLSAQDKTPKIVWNDLREKYENFEDIKPSIELKDVDQIFWKLLPVYNLLYRFDENVKRWIEGNYVRECGAGEFNGTLVLKKSEPIDYFFNAGQFFEREKDNPYFFISQNQKKYPVAGKYKIIFFYGTDWRHRDKLNDFSESPEFLINGTYSEIK